MLRPLGHLLFVVQRARKRRRSVRLHRIVDDADRAESSRENALGFLQVFQEIASRHPENSISRRRTHATYRKRMNDSTKRTCEACDGAALEHPAAVAGNDYTTLFRLVRTTCDLDGNLHDMAARKNRRKENRWELTVRRGTLHDILRWLENSKAQNKRSRKKRACGLP